MTAGSGIGRIQCPACGWTVFLPVQSVERRDQVLCPVCRATLTLVDRTDREHVAAQLRLTLTTRKSGG